MCKKCDELQIKERNNQGRREFILKSAAAVGTVAFSSVATKAFAGSFSSAGQDPNLLKPFTAKGWAARKAKGELAPFNFERRALGPNDVRIDVLYAGICHSDIHTVNEDWGKNQYPIVPGHEIVGKVVAVGDKVTKHKIGDFVGVGCMVDSCGTCVNCKADREQNCLNGTTFTYGAPDKISGGITQGGYSTGMVVKDHFCIKIPDGMDLSRVAPIMCAGITTFSPMQHWNLEEDQEIAVVGVGGLGHMAIKLAVAKGAKVTAFTTSRNKFDAIKEMGATPVLSTDPEQMKKHAMKFDLMITTVPYPFGIQNFLNLLKLDATLVNVGQLSAIEGLSGLIMGFNRQKLAGSMIGGIAETQEVIDFCAKHDILPDVEIIKPTEINKAYSRVVNKDIQFRFVIDMKRA